MSTYRPNLPQGTAPGFSNEFRQIGEATRTLRETNEALSADFSALAGRVTVAESDIVALEAINAGLRLTAVEADVVALEAINAGPRLTALEGTDVSLDGRLDVLEALNAGTRLTSLEANKADTSYVDAQNTAQDTNINSRVLRAGDTMAGLLTLSGAPTLDLHAATKLYVDTGDAARAPTPTNAAGVGQVVSAIPGSAANYTVPAGGSWLVWRAQFNTSTGAFGFIQAASVLAGGTALGAPAAPFTWVVWAWRIA